MANNSFDLSVIISAVDRFTAPVRRMSQRLDGLMSPIRRVTSSFRNLGEAAGIGRLAGSLGDVRNRVAGLGQAVGQVAGQFALLTGGAIFAFNQTFIGTAAKFEKFEVVLRTLEGSSEAAKKSMDWVSDFAAKTPYELDQVMESFVKLRAYGLDPTNGLLKTLGDTGAAMDKPIIEAVEAIADAITGENERLKEFGIKARKEGDKITYEYTNKVGKQMQAVVNANNRANIQKVLEMIWNEKYGGAMDNLSKTWGGMMSNLSDQWTRFANMTMNSGTFEWLKNELQGLLDTVNRMAEDGTLQRWAQQLSDIFLASFKAIKAAIPGVLDGMREFADTVSWVADVVGGWKNLMIGVALVMAAPVIAAILGIGQALFGLGVVLLTTPIGWFLAGLAAIAGAAYLIYKNWDEFKGWWSGLWKQVTDAFDKGFIQGIYQALLTFNPLALVMQGINDIIVWLGGPDLLAVFNDAGERLVNWISDGISTSWEGLKEWFGGLLGALPDLLPDFSEMGTAIVDGIKSGISAGWDALTGWFKEKLSGLTDMLPDWMTPGGDDGEPSQPAAVAGGGALGISAGAIAMARQQAATATGQTIKSDSRVTVDIKGAPRGSTVSTESDGRTKIDASMGYSMVAP